MLLIVLFNSNLNFVNILFTSKMHKLSVLSLTCGLATLVVASPMPSQAEVYATATATSAGAEPTFTIAKRRSTHNCNQDDNLKKIEAQAWADAGAMAKIAEQWDSGNDLQPAMNYYMGADSVKSENFWKIRCKLYHFIYQNYHHSQSHVSKLIRACGWPANPNSMFCDPSFVFCQSQYCHMLRIASAALENENNIHSPNWVFPEAVVDIYCGNTHPTKKNLCQLKTNPNDPKGPKVTAFATSWVERGWFYNSYNIVLCPRFFEQKQSLESLLHDMSTGAKDATNASNYKLAWGHTIYHELMHLDPVIANEEVWDVAYGACPVAKIANQNGCSGDPLWTPPGWDSKKRGPPTSLNNADSWAFFASASYFQKAKELKEPGHAINTCGIYTGEQIDMGNVTSMIDYVPEGILLPAENRTDGTYNAQVPPDPAPENTPPDDPPTPAIPYKVSDLPKGLATPFSAEAYFSTFKPSASPTAVSTSKPISTSKPTSSPPSITSSAPPPKGTTCNCNESSCTPESPDCCANGTCP